MNLLAAFIPYISVLVGMYLFGSAWAAILLYHLGITVFLLIRQPSGIWSKAWAGLKTPLLLPAVGTCALALPVVYFMWPWFAASREVLPVWMERFGLTRLSFILFIPYFSIVHPVLEEIHWRGIAPATFRWLCWQDLLFAGYHILVLCQLLFWPWLFLVFVVLVGSSVFWRWSENKFGGYGLGILTHAAADAGVVIAVWLLLR